MPKINLFFILMILYMNMVLYSLIVDVNQDGSASFTIIQDAINSSANGDTVLVYPGTYYENLVLEEKSITISSLYLTTNDDDYIRQTVIDGDYSDCVIRIENCNSGIIQIIGFNIKNGIGYQYNALGSKRVGGGLYIQNSLVDIWSCLIENNSVNTSGGGIRASNNTQLNLKNNTIRRNHAKEAGGGILIGSDSTIFFDEEDLNNVYLNFAGIGADIFKTQFAPYQTVILDTFTIDTKEDYYIYSGSNFLGTPGLDQISFSTNFSKIERINADLFVSPSGNDLNSGLSENSPLKSISYALALVKSDSLNHNTINLANGIYSSDNEYFPLHIKSDVSILGNNIYDTILDADGKGGLIWAFDPQHNYKLSNLTLRNTKNKPDINIGENTGAIFENLRITGHIETDEVVACTAFNINYSDVTINQIIVENNVFGGSIYYYSPKNSNRFNVSNSIFRNNISSEPGCKQISISKTPYAPDDFTFNLINCEISGNYNNASLFTPIISVLSLDWWTKANIINCTITNNGSASEGAAIGLLLESEINIINSIIYDNSPRNIFLNGNEGANTLTVSNSILGDGLWGIGQYGNNSINIDEETTFDLDPLWNQSGAFPYSLSEDSPCIDAGTLNLPDFLTLPDYDLAGNPRIVNNSIDMGAYEFQDNGYTDNDEINQSATKLSNYPNPFNPNTTISFSLNTEITEDTEVEIYNVRGQKVVTLSDQAETDGIEGRQTQSVTWNGTDQSGNPVASGIYFYKLNIENSPIKKMVLLK